MTVLQALCFAVVLAVSSSTTCTHSVSCPCGFSRRNFTFCAKDNAEENNVCEKWSQCETCEDFTPDCVTCPSGRTGSDCSENINESIQKKNEPGKDFNRTNVDTNPVEAENVWRRPCTISEYPVKCMNTCNTCENLNKPCRQTTCVPGCECKSGFIRNQRGRCVRIWRCNDSPASIVRKKRQSNRERCPTLTAPANGVLRCRRFNRLCVGSCLPGFIFDTSDEETDIILECRRGGAWYPRSSYPRCQREDSLSGCPDPGMPENVYRMDIDGNPDYDLRTFSIGESLTFACTEADLVLQGENLITCRSDGTWSAVAPRCGFPERSGDKKYCPRPKINPNSEILYGSRPLEQFNRFPMDTEFTYGCKDGYDMEGQDVIYCLSTGEWSDKPPICRSRTIDNNVRCPNLGSITDGRVTVYPTGVRLDKGDQTYPGGTRLKYSCENGYVLRGTDSLTCETPGLWSGPPPFCVEECGYSKLEAITKITHGTSTLAGEWPWMVAIAVPRNNQSNVVCGGALINRRTVLTAAHCIVDDEPYYLLYFGKFFRSNRMDDDQVQERRSSQITFHKDYNSETYENDIALVRFQPEVRYTLRILPVCLPTLETTSANINPGHSGYVTGWGYNENDRTSNLLMMASLPLQPLDRCVSSFSNQGVEFPDNPGVMCAGYDEPHSPDDWRSQAACRGDSGSPFVFHDPDSGQYTVEGCVSFSIRGSCGLPGRYTAFTKVANYLQWIRRNMRRRFWEPIDRRIIKD